jgi:VanZ family protein
MELKIPGANSARYRQLALAYALVLTYLSTIPGAADSRLDTELYLWVEPGPQKFMHVVAYAGFAAMLLRARYYPEATLRICACIACFLAVGVGAVTELLQLIIPGRFASLMDIGLNALGALLGVSLPMFYICRGKDRLRAP